VRITSASEFEITNALSKLSQRQQRKVYFVTGHSERLVETPASGKSETATGETSHGSTDTAEDGGGFARAAAALRKEAFDVEPLLLATAERVPEDADALIIAGPTRPFFESEIEAVRCSR
jgi:hypothetical protein